MSKTEELTQQIKELDEKYVEEMSSLMKQRKQAIADEEFDKSAILLHHLYKSYIKVGFTEKQAWELIKLTLKL